MSGVLLLDESYLYDIQRQHYKQRLLLIRSIRVSFKEGQLFERGNVFINLPLIDIALILLIVDSFEQVNDFFFRLFHYLVIE